MKRIVVLAAGIILIVMIALSIYLFQRIGIPAGSFPLKVGAFELKEGPTKRQSGPDTYAAVYNSSNKAPVFCVVAIFPSANVASERIKTITTGFERSKSDFQQLDNKIVRTYYNGSTEISWTHGAWLCIVSSTQKDAALQFAKSLPY